MSSQRDWQENLALGQNEVFEAERSYRTKDEENRTLFNTATFSHDYKLAQAYASVRILEYRGEGDLAVESFDDYLAPRAAALRARFQTTEHSREPGRQLTTKAKGEAARTLTTTGRIQQINDNFNTMHLLS